jgi:hypothetical protein
MTMHDSWRQAANTITATFVLGVMVGALTGLLATGPTYIDRLEGAARSTSDAVTEWLGADGGEADPAQLANSRRSR